MVLLNDCLAMKIEDGPSNGITVERNVLEQVQSDPAYFPELTCREVTPSLPFVVMELLGPSLSKIRIIVPGGRYSAATVVRFTHHSFCCTSSGSCTVTSSRRTSYCKHPVCLIDFEILPRRDERHIEFRANLGIVGTCQ
jgi:hypothetical protein